MKRPRTPDLEDNRPSAKAEWTTPTRARVKQLRIAGHKASEIRQQTGVPERTQTTMIKASVRRPDAERSGRPSKLDDDTVKKMINTLEGSYKRRI
jgi:hypothetical protein